MTVMPKRNDIKTTSHMRNDGRETITIKLIGFDPGVIDVLLANAEMPWDLVQAIEHARTNRT